jgi:hypothetical protein
MIVKLLYCKYLDGRGSFVGRPFGKEWPIVTWHWVQRLYRGKSSDLFSSEHSIVYFKTVTKKVAGVK